MMPRFLFALLWLAAVSCATTREQEIARLARALGAAGEKQRTVAVLTPEIRGSADAAEAKAVAEMLTHELVSNAGFRVAEREQLKDVLREHALAQTGVADPAIAAKLGRLLLVDAVLIGTITGHGDKTEVFLRLVDSETALILRTARGELPKAVATDSIADKTNTAGNAATDKPQQKKERRLQATSTGSAATGTLETIPEAKGKLTDLGYRKGGPGGYHQVIGRVENSGSTLLPDPRVSLQFFDRDKNLVGGSPCVSPDQPVLSGQKLPFACLFKPPADFAYYEAALDTTSRLFANRALNLEVKNPRFRKDTGSITGDYQLSGILTNREESTVTYPRVLLSLFDAQGKFIGSALGFAVKKELAPGAASPFIVTVHAYALQGKPASYEAFYSALLTRH